MKLRPIEKLKTNDNYFNVEKIEIEEKYGQNIVEELI